MNKRKVLFLTGCNGQLGSTIIDKFSNSGWEVFGIDIQEKGGNNYLSGYVSGSVTDRKSFSQLFEESTKTNLNLDQVSLINNAGIFHEEQFEELDPNIWLDEMKINALSPISLTHKLMKNLQAGSTKKVIFLSSQMGSIDDNYSGGYYFYRSSKAALNASAMSLSIDWKDQNIAVLMMHPGWVRTDMGTSKAKLSIEESVTGMLNVIENFTIEQTGAFLNYAGQKLEW